VEAFLSAEWHFSNEESGPRFFSSLVSSAKSYNKKKFNTLILYENTENWSGVLLFPFQGTREKTGN
jgi:hypothetical protein